MLASLPLSNPYDVPGLMLERSVDDMVAESH